MASSRDRFGARFPRWLPAGASSLTSRYLVAFGVFGAALLFRYVFWELLGLKVPFLQFYPAIIFAAWYSGLGPGLLTTTLSAVVAMYLLLPPLGSVAVSESADQLALGVFVATGVVSSWVSHRLRVAQQAQRIATATATAIIDSAVDGIIMIDARGRIEAFNHAAERLFGYTIDEVLGRNVNVLMPSPYREEHDTYLSRYLATGQAKIVGIGREVQGLRKDGTTFPLHLSVGEITVQGERKFTGILHDLTSRVQMEGRFREQEALAKLGQMAAVIAHELKNPLAGIRGAVQVFGGRMIQEPANEEILTEIVTRIDALDRMTKDMLLFARPPKPNRTPIDVVPLVRTTANLLSKDPVLHDVEIEVDGAAPAVSADADMLRVVFQNLLINSAHAMQGKGRIRVAVELVDSTCQIAFVDGGPGIPPEIRHKVFTPFFTTKSRGSGLGLPTVKRLIEAHDGHVTIDCPPDGGTTVVIQLPMHSA